MQPKLYFKKSHAHRSVKDYDRKVQSKIVLDARRDGRTDGPGGQPGADGLGGRERHRPGEELDVNHTEPSVGQGR